jgi:hypothetical protein
MTYAVTWFVHLPSSSYFVSSLTILLKSQVRPLGRHGLHVLPPRQEANKRRFGQGVPQGRQVVATGE